MSNIIKHLLILLLNWYYIWTIIILNIFFIYLFDYHFLSLLFSSLFVCLFTINYQSSILVLLILLPTYLTSLSLFVYYSISQSALLCHPLFSLSSSLIVHYLLRKTLFHSSFKQIIHTGHSHRSSHTEHPIDATFSFPSTQTQQDHTHHTTHSSSNEVFSVSSSSSSMRYDKTRQHNTRKYMTRWLTLSKNDNKNTSGNDKVRIKSPYFLQKSYFIWQNNTKVLIVQYMSNMCSIPKKHLCSLDHQWLVSRWEDEYDHQSSFKG